MNPVVLAACVALSRAFAAGLRVFAEALEGFAATLASASESEAAPYISSVEARKFLGLSRTSIARWNGEGRFGREGEPSGPFRRGNVLMLPRRAVLALERGETYVPGVGEGDGEIAPQRAPAKRASRTASP